MRAPSQALGRICVFAGSSEGSDPAHRAVAISLGEQLAARGITLVYGGASVGLMGILADTVLRAGGVARGVVPESLASQELAHRNLTELKVVGSMHERKAEMAESADAFVALPGGLGTFEELLEVATWSQLGIHAKPRGVLNVNGYFNPLLAQLDRAVSASLLAPNHREIVLAATDPATLLRQLLGWKPPRPKRR